MAHLFIYKHILLAVLLVSLSGCKKCPCATTPKAKEREPGVVDYATGAAQVKAYKDMKATVEKVGERQKDNEVWKERKCRE